MKTIYIYVLSYIPAFIDQKGLPSGGDISHLLPSYHCVNTRLVNILCYSLIHDPPSIFFKRYYALGHMNSVIYLPTKCLILSQVDMLFNWRMIEVSSCTWMSSLKLWSHRQGFRADYWWFRLSFYVRYKCNTFKHFGSLICSVGNQPENLDSGTRAFSFHDILTWDNNQLNEKLQFSKTIIIIHRDFRKQWS